MDSRASELIATLGLQPHPEGGFYRELFRSTDVVTPADGRGSRTALTTIYFLLTAEACSRWHHVSSDEVWHLYEGGPLELLELDSAPGRLTRHCLGRVDGSDNAPVHVVAAGRWQAARCLGPYALMGCSVAPGFEFADFRLIADDAEDAAVIRAEWPDLAELL
jgi:uncharacterized protein